MVRVGFNSVPGLSDLLLDDNDCPRREVKSPRKIRIFTPSYNS